MQEQKMMHTAIARERTILKNVYLWMTAGLALSGLVAWLVAGSPALLRAMVGNPLSFLILVIAQFSLVFYLTARLDRMSASSAIGAFLAYAALNGAMLSTIFIVYTQALIARAFFTTALMFAGMSLYAMTTTRDLHRFGTYLVMGLWGLIIASVLNMLFRSSGLDFLISIAGVVIFLGLTAWDTQKIVAMNHAYGDSDDYTLVTRLSIIGALTLYLDFINLFLFILRIFGRSERR
ncbi:MAG: Inner membrane protein YbhL [Spirochaetes bacterium ADurb.Bin315]|nr:Bax inhibitor-1/YccA family protein [Spirochaetota bacterium]NLL24258.1 Bax inhibitor-1/YccA family protein [Spirochaetales bacterium]OQA41428.1 MAG: Inner membrane protein YbhL [Spirochaetes bacterium ADurb.Bin315]TAH56843.1 MAG: Bax inhibitor-1/YccA family protein [Sphaerochaeta sp.]HOR80806.1 Bax inhibitor-1/YccA family protein [Sphaerochaeta sp.]